MKSQIIYRGTKLSEGLKMLGSTPITKFQYRTNDPMEASSYADLAKDFDKYHKGTILQASMDISDPIIYHLSSDSIDELYDKKSPIYRNHIVMLDAEGLQIYVVPPKLQYMIQSPKMIKVIQ